VDDDRRPIMSDAPVPCSGRRRHDWRLLFALAAVPLLAELEGLGTWVSLSQWEFGVGIRCP
jgi:hypothetical protein